MAESILVVDDDGFSREYLRMLLSAVGYEVHEAADGVEALAAMRNLSPDLVLLDIIMPNKDGLVVCREMKMDADLMDIPVIFLSSRSDVQDKIDGLDAGGSDYIPKPFDPGEVLARVRVHLKLQSLTKELRQANEELVRRQELLEQDLIAAGRIQRSLLPKGNPAPDILDIAWKFQPNQRVGGDIFNVARLGSDHICLYVLDVSGHGVHSALVAVSAFQSLLPQGGNVLAPGDRVTPAAPGDVLSKLDTQFPLERYKQYFTIFYLVLNTVTGHARYSAAGHPPGMLLTSDGRLELLEKGGSFIGLGGFVPFEEGECRLLPGDRLVLYTDGLTDYESEPGQFFGTERFQDRLRKCAGKPLQQMLEDVWASILDFGSAREPLDDMSLLGVTYRGKTSSS